ncbi:HMG-like nucleosome/chromatin assembly factor D, related [Eimeria necatrix]|uniref:HMG-like nucleosome/chromatin assembly factor D, related n=2 Tax=Eimeria TaxID=5800 RepID=U6MYQ9_9EIME|nr:HMG-like nucleosome/chromatin assembly factor D, related [Eimeria tenella]XP_013437548.1 HMG-like nucleosome/chromatin assembly factor D, related [Eimeria necatrix]CDJ37743.1 HMG-like nucleosome/chromatin assembly factor D, related [Eimeria tenella]CDJ69081.1 HMG-like nucleosome/chromatin assembly factor D, related [Eimeria necatrix]|eukprot:XP_013228581.1 HMG-like nucleosome/chromatin assembly factor D, related [Eimeria tenella]
MAPKKAAKAAKPTKRTRAKKDPDAPKRGTPAYIFFMKDKREEICKKNPNVKSATQIAALVGEEWKKLSPSQKAPYEKKAEADKQRYQKEVAAYKKNKAGQ